MQFNNSLESLEIVGLRIKGFFYQEFNSTGPKIISIKDVDLQGDSDNSIKPLFIITDNK